MKLKVSEHQLMTLLKNYLEAKGWFVMRLNSGALRTDKGHMVRLSQAGTPDLMAIRKCKRDHVDIHIQDVELLFIEVKTPQNPKPTFAQEQMMQTLTDHGARCLVIHSLEELQELLND